MVRGKRSWLTLSAAGKKWLNMYAKFLRVTFWWIEQTEMGWQDSQGLKTIDDNPKTKGHQKFENMYQAVLLKRKQVQ